MKTKDITPSEYAQIKGVSLQHITKQIRDGKQLPGVISVNKFGRFYLLTVDKNILKEKVK